jgi:hypothetical protein
MRLSLTTILLLRRACLGLIAALEAAALEAYGWTPDRRRAHAIDNRGTIET